MLTLRSKNVLSNTVKHSLLAGAFLLLVILGAKIDLGGTVSFTLQTLFLGLAYCYLPKPWKLVLIAGYLFLGIAGFSVFNGGAGWDYFSSWPLGFFIGFVFAAFVPLSKPKDFLSAMRFFLQMHVVIIICGTVGVGLYSGSAIKSFDMFFDILPGAVLKSTVGAGFVWLVIVFKKV